MSRVCSARSWDRSRISTYPWFALRPQGQTGSVPDALCRCDPPSRLPAGGLREATETATGRHSARESHRHCHGIARPSGAAVRKGPLVREFFDGLRDGGVGRQAHPRRPVKFHQTWFRPNNGTLVVIGDTTLAEITPKLEKLFAGWPKRCPGQKHQPRATSRKPVVYIMDRPGALQSDILVGTDRCRRETVRIRSPSKP